ncbi:DUF4124 domain-containing protein [Granulosicoccus antarcticus]|uniref:DUF4124 domain-containing protein n=1 Tax=Granulosicoccus antarcticus IMCC3135 TaxID=1192854 RepID=A0A2Z2NTL9_9GAMM|nr:DUF4124 domain-containing protein [Granulosicoccus antarcticus]ASJ70464.1 hypothetical protein IMCC3135_01725 [Granulosicoccus antarcticus IMCC3135]
MLWRILAKLLFKVSVPLVLLAGMLSYGHYLRGGDPGALWQGIAGRASDQVASLFSGVRNDASKVTGVLTRGVSQVSGIEGQEGLTQVYMWKDAAGVTHYSTAEPAGVIAKIISVDPNVNVLAPVRAPVASTRQVGGVEPGDTGEPSGQMPGVAGQVLSTRGHDQGGDTEGSTTGADIDPAQLLRMIQAAQK